MNSTITYQEYPRTNREYKSTLFVMAFSEKKDLLSLFNAMNGTNYDNPDDLEITTLESAIYLSYKNDVSFLVGGIMNLHEQQSTFNPNMPIRGVLYFARLYEKYITQHDLNIYSTSMQKLPTPRYVVFYNGTKTQPDRSILKLSDAYMQSDGCLECEVTMININYGHNRDLMDRCKRLEDYSYFIFRIREMLQQGLSRDRAINQAIDECIEENRLKDILMEQRSEVLGVLLSTFNKELYEQGLKDDAYQEGVKEGIKEGTSAGIRNLIESLQELGIAKELVQTKIMEKYDIPQEELEKLLEKYWQYK